MRPDNETLVHNRTSEPMIDSMILIDLLLSIQDVGDRYFIKALLLTVFYDTKRWFVEIVRRAKTTKAIGNGDTVERLR